MDIIAQNPYRVLGMFANDSLKVMTANIARIRAFSKVGKECVFESDCIEIFGPIDRSESAVENAISLLSSTENVELYASMWLHKTDTLETTSTDISEILRSQIKDDSLEALYNVMVCSLFDQRNELCVEYTIKLFSSNTQLGDQTKIQILKQTETFRVAQNGGRWFYLSLWPLYERTLNGSLIQSDLSKLIRQTYYDFAVEEIIVMAKAVLEYKTEHYWCLPYWVEKNMQNVVDVLHTAIGQNTNDLEASAQLALNQLGEAILKAGKEYFSAKIMWNVKDCEKLLTSLRTAYTFICDSELKESCAAFGKEVKSQIKYLAPHEVIDHARHIKKFIEEFCERQDKVQYALRLIKDCTNPLRGILNALGKDNLYYRRISTQIADNAIYSADVDLSTAVRMYNNPDNDRTLAMAHLMDILKQCRLLAVNIGLFNLEDEFLSGKFLSFTQFIERTANKYGIVEEAVIPDISLSSDYDLFMACGEDYQKLKEFITSHSENQYLENAIQKVWAIEDNAYPKLGDSNSEYRKALLEYKIKFPTSHNEEKLLTEITTLLFGQQFGSIFEYRQFIRLWPDHPKKQIALDRIDRLTFLSCSTIEDFNRYLKEYPQGKCRVEAKAKITELQNIEIKKVFDQCTTIADYKRFISKYPTSDLFDAACAKIEDIVYDNAQQDNNYATYLMQYSNGRYAEKARHEMEYALYQRVIKNQKYDEYYRLYPNGKYLAQIKDAQEERCFKACKRLSDYKQYLKDYPTGKYTLIAQSVINRSNRRTILVAIGAFLGVATLVILVCVLCHTGSDSVNNLAVSDNENNEISETLDSPQNDNIPTTSQLPKDPYTDRYSELSFQLNHFGITRFGTTPSKIHEYITSHNDGYNQINTALINKGAKFFDNGKELESWLAKGRIINGDEDRYNNANGSTPIYENINSEAEYINNRLATGARPYKDYYGKSIGGEHRFTFKTSSGSDYIILVKRHNNGKYIDHKYVRGGESVSITVPDGVYDVYFYSGNGWNPDKTVGACSGGFVSGESFQKDGPVTMNTTVEGDYYYNQTYEYTLYPVRNGNLSLKSSNPDEAFN